MAAFTPAIPLKLGRNLRPCTSLTRRSCWSFPRQISPGSTRRRLRSASRSPRATALETQPSRSTDETGLADDQAGWVVHKFGGSSLANAQAFGIVGEVVSNAVSRDGVGKVVVVVSAVAGVTDMLENLVSLALHGNGNGAVHYLEGVEKVRELHRDLAGKLLGKGEEEVFLASFESDLKDLKDLLRAVWIARSASLRVKELVMGFGELWSAQLLWGILRSQHTLKCSWMDAREVIVARETETRGPRKVVQMDSTRKLMEEWLKSNPTDCIVVTGYVCQDSEGVSTTLGRNGSDYSASILANILGAKELNIWTDVDGVFSANPQVVTEAIVIPDMTYTEAAELAYFGAEVLHPDTMGPAMEKHIPLRIRNTFNLDSEGTVVHASAPPAGAVMKESFAASLAAIQRDAKGVKGFSTISDIAMVNLEGTGMIGVPGIASRAFRSLFQQGVSVILIAQASSEYSICMAVPGNQGPVACNAIRKTFRAELEDGLISRVELVPDCSILAMVGENMRQTPGVCSRLFSSLTKAGINIRAMTQGSSEHNISVVVNCVDESRALRAVHAGFYLSDQTLSIGVIGPGVVGGALIEQIGAQVASLREEFGVDMRVRGIATSSKMIRGDNIDLTRWRHCLQTEGEPVNLEAFARHIDDTSLPHAVICDCTASQAVTDWYERWIRDGIHIITPNKKANSGPLSYYFAIREAQRGFNTHFFYEANVGAGLPIISSIRDLLRTGDRFLEIQGIFSGTLSYIFNTFDGSKPFSSIVKGAKELGYTEPDPREDLSGMDVARKVVILAREIGLEVELEDVPVKSLVPEALRPDDVSVAQFMQRLPEYDSELTTMAREAAAAGEMLRYVGIVDVEAGKCSVELRRFGKEHPFGRLQGSDNIVTFRTKRYDAQPLVVQGPGAGAQVTAAGVFGDLLRLAAYLGAPSTAYI